MIRAMLAAAAATAVCSFTPSAALANPYPTETSVDYVIGCMAANGQTQDSLRRCSCSIDAISSALPFELYERAETILRMRGAGGESASLFRETPMLADVVTQLRAAQVEADFRCF